jgi:hypothetical protein
MSDQKPSDKAAFEQLIRSGRRTNRVDWVPAPGQDDRDALNQAIREASGRGKQEQFARPFPWKSIEDDGSDGDDRDTR